jgi:hypothetical protein
MSECPEYDAWAARVLSLLFDGLPLPSFWDLENNELRIRLAVCEATGLTRDDWERLPLPARLPWLEQTIEKLIRVGDTPQAETVDEPAKPMPPEQLPLEGTQLREEDVPAAFRDGGKPEGAVLTANYLEDALEWELLGPYLSKNYGPGKVLTTHIKVGRAKAYLFKEVSALRIIKTANQAERERRAAQKGRY